MLKYLIETAGALAVPAVVVSFLLALCGRISQDRGGVRISWSLLLCCGVSLITAGLRMTTRAVNQELLVLHLSAVCAVICLLLLGLIPFSRRFPKTVSAFASMAAFCLFYEQLPSFLLAPAGFVPPDQSVFSADFLLKLAGWGTGAALCILAAWCATVILQRLSWGKLALLAALTLLAVLIRESSVMLQIMLARRIIPLSRGIFSLVKFTSNYSECFVFAVLALANAAGLCLFIGSFRAGGPYENPAMARLDRAARRRDRCYALLEAASGIALVLILTVGNEISSRGFELSPAEHYDISDRQAVIPLEKISDGHLHRFEYLTPGGVTVRFIVIKKPSSMAFGVGFDACEICGATGYYERDGQVVCMLCDVVMNINTIGYRGGCNPIPLAYRIEEGAMVIELDDLAAAEKIFR